MPEEGNSAKKSSVGGLDENVAAALSYVLGIITGIIFFVMEKDSKFVKFHAMQSILVSAALIVLNMILGFIPFIGWLLNGLLVPLGFILWLILIFQAYKNAYFKLPVIGDFAEKQVENIRA